MNSINIGIILDRSGSVENEKIPLEDSMNLLMESFERKYKENTKLKLLIITLENDDISIQDKKIILFSDGYFSDKDNSFLNEKKEETEDKTEKISVGIGEGYRKITLEKFSTNGIVFEYQDIYDLI